MENELLEINIKPIIYLNDYDKEQVMGKLIKIYEVCLKNKTKPFNFRGFVKISIYRNETDFVYKDIEPIEGTPGENLKKVLKNVET